MVQRQLKSWLDAGLGFFYPNVCQICSDNRATATAGYVCQTCCRKPEGVKWLEAPYCAKCGTPFEGEISAAFQCSNCAELDLKFDCARAGVELTEIVRDAIHRYKYNQALWFEPFLTGLLLERALAELTTRRWDMVVPVPLHPVKKREREFNQAERLGASLARALEVPLRCDIIERVEVTDTQTHLTRRQRADNVKRAFGYKHKERLSGASIVLVDDVLTTGATCSACAKLLKDNGASSVEVWTVARGTLL
jgi:competence protein ComFC